jgi:uncharacterized protein (TIGR00251 family)
VVGFRFAVRVKPGARREFVGGSRDGSALTVAVTAPAVDGRANVAVCAAVAKAFGVRARDVSVVAGGRGRDKVVEVELAPTDAAERLSALLALRI